MIKAIGKMVKNDKDVIAIEGIVCNLNLIVVKLIAYPIVAGNRNKA